MVREFDPIAWMLAVAGRRPAHRAPPESPGLEHAKAPRGAGGKLSHYRLVRPVAATLWPRTIPHVSGHATNEHLRNDQPGTDIEGTAVDRRERWLRRIVIVALIIASLYFAWRGIWRGIADSGDLAVGYAAARAWLVGQNPYDPLALQDELSRSGAPLALVDQLSTLRNVYFPATLVFFVPFALLPWMSASLLWVASNVVATLVIALGLARILDWRLTDTRALGLTACLLALSPVHLTMASGQTGLAATALLVVAVSWERSGPRAAPGVLYGLAMVSKLQIGLPFFAYLLARRRWAMALRAGLALGFLTALSVTVMHFSGVSWLPTWTGNVGILSGPGGINDSGFLNPDRYSLVNLQYPLQTLGFGAWWSDSITFGLVGLAGLATIWSIRGRRPRAELLSLSIVGVLSLLVTYHRYYDAVLLALPIAWAISALGTPNRRASILALILCANFVLPFQTALHDIEQRGLAPDWLTDTWFWDAVLLTQHAWALVLLVLVLLWAALRDGTPHDEPAR